MIEDFSNEFTRDDIHVRDHLQFEQKSEFIINPSIKHNTFKQEFYLFIPTQLQINSKTYSKTNFYLDQTNLIRYKTPRISLKDLVNPLFTQSPLYRLQTFANSNAPCEKLSMALDEIKLFGNIFKTALRERVYQLAHSMDDLSHEDIETHPRQMVELCEEVKAVCSHFRELQLLITKAVKNNQIRRHLKYIDEFISNTIDEYLTILLHEIEAGQTFSEEGRHRLSQVILHEKNYRTENHLGPKTATDRMFANESILHRQSLLNRFVQEALQLKSYRKSFEEKHGDILGAVAAGIATLVYTLFFIWNASAFINTSVSFVMLAVIIYILRDSIKDSLKKIFFKQANKWLHDYSTKIKSPKGIKIGLLKENFFFITPRQLPPGFLEIRNYHFNEELQALQRQESIIQYKREIELVKHLPEEGRRREVTMIFRLNIERFIRDASDPLQPNLMLDSYTHEIKEILLPKVYHLNLIIRNSYFDTNKIEKSEIKKYRVVVDKVGIKRVEQIK